MVVTHIVYLSGIDGTGKTSIANCMVKMQLKLGEKPVIVKCGANIRFFTLPFYVLGRCLNLNPIYPLKKRVHTSRYPDVHHSALLSKMFCLAVLADTIIVDLVRVRIPYHLGRSVISDRHVLDVLIELMIATGNTEIQRSFIGRQFLKLVQTKNVFLIDISEEIAYQRKDDVPSIEYLGRRRLYFLKLGQDINFVKVINGAQSVRQISEEIMYLIQ